MHLPLSPHEKPGRLKTTFHRAEATCRDSKLLPIFNTLRLMRTTGPEGCDARTSLCSRKGPAVSGPSFGRRRKRAKKLLRTVITPTLPLASRQSGRSAALRRVVAFGKYVTKSSRPGTYQAPASPGRTSPTYLSAVLARSVKCQSGTDRFRKLRAAKAPTAHNVPTP